jgi:hypothetical protein
MFEKKKIEDPLCMYYDGKEALQDILLGKKVCTIYRIL